MTVNLSADTVAKAQALFADDTDASNFIVGTVQQIYDYELGTDEAIKIFTEQARFAEAQLAIVLDVTQKKRKDKGFYGRENFDSSRSFC